ncbi:mRNA-binding translational repressor SSD1 KNAG_0M01650 [Huiozyma naganishii CBS 8797]|uniref:RNB domain-containing protein n=1 Tax=Huiozyma naganishii (strain ATCC MYA-139 / BCRC 22969 / CBS 8797 / KCTC 17520 / NBRC 10181 / NCYC 3082 / Yp74L-3) TaxID=1071383 RepID=J7RSX7_HUIN7|nr:hypothetical protein KNAG_0M01650 [Kazachstania naganishii CBS 8797]CCK73018.1 hypothetical protein KNAG_0M01650 [Kazachstania naganishii CBS 8797]
MSAYNNNNNNSQQNDNVYVPAHGSGNGNGGRNAPKQIHVAHRRSQSELTNLMIEQLTLQKQLELVQQQQQQLLAQQPQLAQQTQQYGNTAGPVPPFVPPNPHYSSNYGNSPSYNNNNNNTQNRSRSHSRNNSAYYTDYNNNNSNNSTGANSNTLNPNSHRKTGSQSSNYGHARRHSLQLNEAKKAAAEEQAKRTGVEFNAGGVSVTVEDTSTPDLAPPAAPSAQTNEQSNFQFPPPSNPTYGDHRRSNSNLAPSTFRFPPSNTAGTPSKDDDFILTSSTHRRTRTRNSEFSPGIHSNWRTQSQTQQQIQQSFPYQQQQPQQQQPQQQQQQSPFRHNKSNSRDYNSFSTLEPPAFFQGHRQRNSNSSVHSFQSNGGGNSNSQSNTRKSLFAPYLPQANIPQLIEEGRLVAGILRVNKKNRSDAWVSTDGALDADIYICGSKDRNRALEGDLVAVELLVVDEVWDSKREKEEKKRRKDAASLQQDLSSLSVNDDYHNDASASTATGTTTTSALTPTRSMHGDDHVISTNNMGSPTKGGGLKRKGSLKQRPTQKKNDDVEVEGQSLLLVEEEEINDKFKPLYAGHVVAVLDRIPGQLFSGTLGLLRPSQQVNKNKNDDSHESSNRPQQAPKIAWFKPTDKKVPLIAIPTELAPRDFVENADKYSDRLFVASIKRWPITSLHPFGILVSELGEINDPNTEIDSILRDNNFLSNEYLDPRDPTHEKATYQPFPISEENWAKRHRLINENITAVIHNGQISEFALHITENPESGTIELGCHVVDVTAEIEANSSLDRRARKRSTAVFMPQKVVHLLPHALNAALTLQQGKESPTISVIYTLDMKTLKVKSTWIGETNITPHRVVTLEDIDTALIDGEHGDKQISLMEEVATALYAQRIGLPGAKLQPTMSLFESLDDEKVKVDLNIFDRTLAFTVINEIQRKVNSTVAERIYSKLGDNSFLRRQPQPILTKLTSFKKKVQKLGFDVDVTTSDSILHSILQIPDVDVRKTVEILLFKTMLRAKYFVAGKIDPDQYGHYALNLPIYTHFTNPMRRYADHVVHRQLKAVINDVPYTEDIDSLKITTEYCNFKKDCAYQAQEQAVHLLLCKTINDMGNATGQLATMATVTQVYESSFDVFIPEFGIEKRVHGDQLPLIKAEFDGVNKVLELYWQLGVDSATFVPADERNPKSYRSSIKNKFKSTTAEIVNFEFSTADQGKSTVSDDLGEELSRLHLEVPTIRLPNRGSPSEDPLDSFISTTVTRTENDNHIQQILELQQVPVLLRAEIGMALPCLSVRALNPYLKRE